MLNESRTKVYLNAYLNRLQKGESLEEIDKSYLDLKRLTKDDIEEIHELVERTKKPW